MNTLTIFSFRIFQGAEGLQVCSCFTNTKFIGNGG